MKIYALFHNVMHEGSEPVAFYVSQTKADAEASRLNQEYVAKRQADWNSLSKADQRMLGPISRYVSGEGWSVDGFDVIE